MSRQPRNQGPSVGSATTRQNEYFVPRDGIDREVISADICRYLGNDALVRPGHYEVRKPMRLLSPFQNRSHLCAEPPDRSGGSRLLHYRLQEPDHCEYLSVQQPWPSDSLLTPRASSGHDRRPESRFRAMGQ